MSSSTLYRSHTDALLLQAQLDATQSVDAASDDRLLQLFAAIEAGAARRFYGHPAYAIDDYHDQRTMLAGVLAAHVLHAALRAEPALGDSSLPDMVAAGLAALRVGDLDARLPASRGIEAAADSAPSHLRSAVDDLSRMLRRTGTELIASAGHLTRTVVTNIEHYRPHLAAGWYALHGPSVLLPRAVSRAAAVAMVASGRPKTAVAQMGGLSRSTLDAWLD